MNSDLRRRLIAAAAQEDAFIHYDEVAEILGIFGDRLDHSAELGRELDEISTFEHRHGRPLLTAVVVRKDDMRPGKGFFKMARRHGKFKRQGKDEFYLTELARVRRYWAQPSNYGPELGVKGGSPGYPSGLLGARPDGPIGNFRLAFSVSQNPECGAGSHVTAKFVVGDNSRIRCAVLKRRTRLVPMWFRSARFEVLLKDAANDEIAQSAMKEGGGRIFVRGKSGVFGGKLVEIERVIQDGGEYYLQVEWGSLIRSWEVRVFEPSMPQIT